MKISKKTRRNLRFLGIAGAVVLLALPLTIQLIFLYGFLEDIVVGSALDLSYAYEWLISGNDKINLRFDNGENIYLHVSRGYISFLVPGGFGPYTFVNLEAYLPNMMTKEEYYKLHAAELNGARPNFVPPEEVDVSLALLGAMAGESGVAAFSDVEDGAKLAFTVKTANDIHGYAVYKDLPISEEDEDTSLYLPVLQKSTPYFVDCSGQNGIDQTCNINVPYRGVLNVEVTIAPSYIYKSGQILTESEGFLDSIYCDSTPSSKP